MATELVVAAVVEAFDRRLLDGPVHPFDLPVGPWMPGLGQAVADVVLRASELEGVRAEQLAAIHCRADVGCS
jgi:hypothetical protein